MSTAVTSLGVSDHQFTNWVGTQTCRPELFFEPQTTEHIKQIVAAAREKGRRVKVVGKGHSFPDLACTADYMISLDRYNQVLQVDEVNRQVKVQAGCTVSTLIHDVLPTHGLTLSVLGVVSEVTVGGWISTGTHGTGAQYGTSSSLVVSLELMTASGEIMHISREGNRENREVMRAAVLSLGSLGVILTVTLQCEPAFNLLQKHCPAELGDVLENLEEKVTSADRFHLEVFPYTEGVVCVQSTKTTQEPTQEQQGWFSAFLGTVLGFPGILFMLWVSTFLPRLVPFLSRFFYRHTFSPARHRVDSGQNVMSMEGLPPHHCTEWAIHRQDLSRALRELQSWIQESGFPAHFPIVCRFVKGEDIYLSPAYGRDTCYVQALMFRPFHKDVPHDQYWQALERIMSDLGGRPHWGKEHGLAGQDLQKVYPKWREFCTVRQQLDPNGMFLNDHLNRLFDTH